MDIRKIILIVLLASLTACFSNPLPEVDEIQISSEELNNKISLTVPNGWNDFKIGDKVTLSIVNVSEDRIIFDSHYGIRIFMYEKEKWIEIKNQLIRLNTENIILVPNKVDTTATGTITILPKLNSQSNRLTIRVYVVGYLYKDNKKTDEKAGAFIDIVLKK